MPLPVDGLGLVALFGGARHPLAIDLESREPDFAVALQVVVQAVFDNESFHQVVHGSLRLPDSSERAKKLQRPNLCLLMR